MSSIRQTLAIGALSALAAAQVTPPKLEAPCADVVIFMARGNDAPYHDGRTFPFVEATCGKFTAQGKSCDYIDIQYDVTLGADYCTQVAEGARNGISQITAFNQQCPCTHIVVNGYSEGAHVVGDVLGGPGGCTFVSTGLDNTSSAGKAIGAALLWGNVMHTSNQPYNVLDGASLQKNPRSADDLARLGRYAPLLRDYCAAGDPVCAGGSVVADHLNYFELYTDEASSWVVSKIDGTADLCPASSSSSSAPATSSTAASSSVVVPESSTLVTVPSSTGAASSPSASVTKEGFPTAVYPTGGYPTGGYSTSAAPSSTVTPAPFPEPIGYEEACHVVYEVQYKYE
ncbi:hypothetical protein G6514_008252 [Epicoccum nigrum]|nr:hypothetical protein G6514_008252 [Epicoccum nigrum]